MAPSPQSKRAGQAPSKSRKKPSTRKTATKNATPLSTIGIDLAKRIVEQACRKAAAAASA
eukprot:CAMPEP_0172375294 /NCGR_PEP_ID=MMETSP1060-20121228/60859_1 /TAXON_ID=37318 /ORGANISM="Pseudo-nitzschia pungens, Strain cf. cingulata" /LENGTH=59 /DNA_ID=CAMNT_0013102365 /DNA_START=76 /DNA_END=252 /DNA_ORIENTATION=+